MIELSPTALWPHWLRPFWLLLVPLLAWLLWRLWHREKRAGRWQLLLPAAFHAALLSGGQSRASRLPWVALGLAWLLAVLPARPEQRLEQDTLKPADPLVVLLELTPAMLAGDASPTRLEQARRKILDLLEARQDAQTALVVYAGSAHTLVPLSDDLATSRNLLEALKPSIMPEPGRRADLAVAKALTLLEQGGQGQGRLLLIGSALDERERQGIGEALEDRRERLHILGVGTPQGAPIVQQDGSFLKDAQGAILIPRLDSAAFSRLAREVGGAYRRLRLDDGDLRSLSLLDAPRQLRDDGDSVPLQAWADQGHWLLLPLLLLAACAGRRGWLFCLPLLLLAVPQSGLAAPLDDLWLRPDQQGRRLLEAQRPAEAAQRFDDPQWQGLALYQAGDYAAAAERFAQGDSAAAHYNRGNALARSNELEAALDAYERALELQPELPQAQKNKALVEQLLSQGQEPARAEEPDNSAPQDEQDATAPSGATPPEERPGNPSPGQAPPGAPQEPAGEERPGPGDDGAPPPEPPAAPGADEQLIAAEQALDGERRQALEQWLRQIPDDPAELLKRKFWYQQQQRQEQIR